MPPAPADGAKADPAKRARPMRVGRQRDTERDNGKAMLHPPKLVRPPYWIKAGGR